MRIIQGARMCFADNSPREINHSDRLRVKTAAIHDATPSVRTYIMWAYFSLRSSYCPYISRAEKQKREIKP